MPAVRKLLAAIAPPSLPATTRGPAAGHSIPLAPAATMTGKKDSGGVDLPTNPRAVLGTYSMEKTDGPRIAALPPSDVAQQKFTS